MSLGPSFLPNGLWRNTSPSPFTNSVCFVYTQKIQVSVWNEREKKDYKGYIKDSLRRIKFSNKNSIFECERNSKDLGYFTEKRCAQINVQKPNKANKTKRQIFTLVNTIYTELFSRPPLPFHP